MELGVNNQIDRISEAARREIPIPPESIQKTHAVRFPTSTTKLFKITGNANSGGYYTAYEQQFDATVWKTTADPLGNIGVEIEIWNLAEAGNTGTNYLAVGEYVEGRQFIDDEGNRRWRCCKYVKSCT